jgi:hypothetical protein
MLPVLRELLEGIPDQRAFNIRGKQIIVNDSL